jgi:hypothetical protein
MEIKKIAYMDEMVTPSPNLQTAKIRIGILSKKIHVPVLTGVSRFSMIAMPVIPPGAMLFGSISRLTATA